LIQYENSRDVVDLQLSTRILKQKAELRFNISDLLNQYIIIYCNNVNRNKDGSRNPGLEANDDPKGEAFNEAVDLIYYKARKGTTFSVSINYKF